MLNNRKYLGLAVLAAVVANVTGAQANCKKGTPFLHQVVLDAMTNEQQLHDSIFPKLLDISSAGGWNLARGFGDPMNTELEYNKMFVSALLLARGIDNTELEVSKDLTTGMFGYTADQIYLNKSYHRGRDEWQSLVADFEYGVYDSINPNTGAFEFGGRSFGPSTFTAIADELPPEWYSPGIGPGSSTSHSENGKIEYYCGSFETADGWVDESTFMKLGWSEIGFNWFYLRGWDNVRQYTDAPDGAAHEGIGRETLDQGIGVTQLAQRFVCDIMDAPADWVPQMVLEVAAATASKYLDASFYDGLPAQRLPFTCGQYADSLATPDGSKLCASGNVACQSNSDCMPGKEECSGGCCLDFVK